MLRNTSLFGLILIIISCTSESFETEIPEFSGYYKIESFRSSENVDLDNDGIAHQNLQLEMGYYFENSHFDLEVKPHDIEGNPTQLISFYIPHPYLVFYNSDSTHYDLEFARSAFSALYHFEERFVLNNSDFDEFGRINEINLLDEDHIQLVIEKSYYDFNVQQWKILTISANYSKTSIY